MKLTEFSVTFRETNVLTYLIPARNAGHAEKRAEAMRKARDWDRFPHREETEGTAGVESIKGRDGVECPGLQRAHDLAYRNQARAIHAEEGEIEIDDNAKISRGDDAGAYVQAWVWVPGCERCREALSGSVDDDAGMCANCAANRRVSR